MTGNKNAPERSVVVSGIRVSPGASGRPSAPASPFFPDPLLDRPGSIVILTQAHSPVNSITATRVRPERLSHSQDSISRENSQKRRRHGEHRDSPQIHIMRSPPSPRALLGAISQGS